MSHHYIKIIVIKQWLVFNIGKYQIPAIVYSLNINIEIVDFEWFKFWRFLQCLILCLHYQLLVYQFVDCRLMLWHVYSEKAKCQLSIEIEEFLYTSIVGNNILTISELREFLTSEISFSKLSLFSFCKRIQVFFGYSFFRLFQTIAVYPLRK